jgi:SnoaL-like protein
MTDITAVVHNYIALWNETTPEDRRALVAETFADEASYVDPLMSGAGHEGIDAMVAGAQKQFPGARFELSQGPDAHNDRVRFAWTLVSAADGTPVAAGVDFATVAADGRLRDVTGFLEPAA